MFQETMHPYSEGTILPVQFKLHETDDHPIIAQARVVYAHEGIGVGLAFSSLEFEDRQKIEKFIEQEKE